METRFTYFDKNITGLSADALSVLAETAEVGLWNWHLPSDEIRLNRSIAQLTGYELGEVPHRGSTRNLMIYKDDLPKVEENVNALIRGGISQYHIEYRMNRRDGSIVWVSEAAVVYEKDENGKPVRLAGLAFDLSMLKQAEQKARDMEAEVKRLSNLTEEGSYAEENRLLRAGNAATALLIGDVYHDYETVLRLSLQILGESVQAERAFVWRNKTVDNKEACFFRAEWTRDGSAVFNVNNEEEYLFYDDFFPNWQVRMAENHYICAQLSDLEETIQQAPGVLGAKSVMLIPFYLHGVFWGGIGFATSEEDRMFTQLEAQVMNANGLPLASSISRNETFGKLNQAREEALASTKAKTEFLSRMSHEIRTPMNAIIGMTALAHKTDDLEKIKDYLSKVDASSRQLLAIINDVLDMSKIDADKFEITNTPFDFDKMLENVFNVVHVKLEEKSQNLFFETNGVFTRYVDSDELRLSQVLINLLNNANKFTPEEGQITLKIDQYPGSEAGKVRIHGEVIDTGIGISEEAQKRLFQSFEQADGSITREYGGTGLGLAICKKIIDLMGGQIWVESEEGNGTTFLFEIEVALGEKLPMTRESAKSIAGLRVLVVDDQEDVLEYFEKILTGFSVDCDTATNGKEAVALMEKSMAECSMYNMVFIDWNMPGMKGNKVAEEIERISGGETVVVLISVADWGDIEKEARASGVTNFLPKPVLPSSLFNTIAELMHYDFNAQEESKLVEDIDWHDKRILLVEDVEINRVIVEGMLEETEITIESAENGKEAVDLFKEKGEAYDLILMDIQMPVMDGLEATRRIRLLGTEKAEEIPIVAMTANAFKEDERLCLEAGMNKHIAKPFSPDELLSVLHRYLDKEREA
ncbi:MAG: response regulator [Christensenellaceae bacterium]